MNNNDTTTCPACDRDRFGAHGLDCEWDADRDSPNQARRRALRDGEA